MKLEKEWAKVLYVEGVKPDQNLPAEIQIKRISYKTLSPEKLAINADLTVKTLKTKQNTSSNKINVAWKKTLDTIPEQHTQVKIRLINTRPKYLPPVKKINKVTPTINRINAKTIRNRIALRGKLVFQVDYQADKSSKN